MDVEDEFDEIIEEEETPQFVHPQPAQRYQDVQQQLRHENIELRTTMQLLKEACEREINKRDEAMAALKARTEQTLKMAWGHHDAMGQQLKQAKRDLAVCAAELEYQKDVEDWQRRRIEQLEQALVKCEKTRRAIFQDARDDEETGTFESNKKAKTLHLVVVEEPRPQRKRRASRELDMGAGYVDDGVVNSTRELRQTPSLQCDSGWQRCHLVGLNLLKRILNHYSQVRQLRLEPSTYAVLRATANEPTNLQCCTPEENRDDTVVEKEVLDHLFRGETLQSAEAKQMLVQLQSLLAQVDSLTGDPVLEQVLSDLRASRFPLQRYCFSCRSATTGREPTPSTRAFCSVLCQRAWHED